MIESLLPALAGAELFHDVPESTMFSVKFAVVKGAVAERRREFGTVRYCARQALQKIGVAAVPILPDMDGAPRWPVGPDGSMTHCPGYRAAVVARDHDLCGVGIDAEPHTAVPTSALDLIFRDKERARLSALASSRPDPHWNRVLFCVKEAVYKAWFSLTRRWLEFEDVSMTAHFGGTFGARVRVPDARAEDIDLGRFDGRWMVDRGLVITATTISQARAARTSTLAGAT